jgi:peptide/nickel transport system substrate-binding protein
LVVLGVVVAIVVVVAVSGGDDTPDGGRAARTATTVPDQLVVRGLNVDWINFDFQVSNQNHNMPPVMAAYDRLIAYGPDFQLQPYLATKWEVTPADKPTKAVLTIRDGATCADGTPITPEVVRASLNRLFTVEKTSNLVLSYFGPGPYKVTADDAAKTVTFETETPARNLIYGFAWPGSSIICPAGLKAVESDPKALETAMYGSGPYELVSAVHADRITFKQRPGWDWGPNGSSTKTLPKTLIYRYLEDETTAANLLITGGLDIAWVTGPDAKRVKAQKGLVHKVGQNYSPTMLAFNMFPDRKTNDEKLREAIMAAVDPAAWNQAAYAGFGVITRTVLVPGMDCYDDSAASLAPAPSLDAARRLLTEAGYTLNGEKLMKDGKQLRLQIISPSNAAAAAADYMVDQLSKLGIGARVGAAANYATDAVGGNFDVGVITGTAVAPLAGANLPTFTGKAPPNGSNLANTGGGDPELTELATQASQHAGEAGCEFFSGLQRRMIEQHYAVGLAAPSQQMAGKGWDYLPVQFWEPSSFKYTGEGK